MKIFITPVIFIAIITGCASQQLNPLDQDMQYAEHFAKLGDYKFAFWKIRDPVNSPAYLTRVSNLTKNYPQIITEGKMQVMAEHYASLIESGEIEQAKKEVQGSLSTLKILLPDSEYKIIEQRANNFLMKDSILQLRISVWQELTDLEIIKLQKIRFISLKDDKNFGRIIDKQIFDASTKGTQTGSQLGSIVGQAQYIDNSIPKGAYSATGQVGAAIIGAALGRSFDQTGSRVFVTRYTIKRLDGKVSYADKYEATSLGESAGVCVDLQAKQVDQDICDMTPQNIRSYLSKAQIDN